jgi:hypothetical protein
MRSSIWLVASRNVSMAGRDSGDSLRPNAEGRRGSYTRKFVLIGSDLCRLLSESAWPSERDREAPVDAERALRHCPVEE